MADFDTNFNALQNLSQYQGVRVYQIYAVAVVAAAFGIIISGSTQLMNVLHPSSIEAMPSIGQIIDTSAFGGINLGDYKMTDLKTQFRMLISAANRLGLYVAADYLARRLAY